MAIKRVEYKATNRVATYAHLFDTGQPWLPYGQKVTLCGKRFNIQDATVEALEDTFRGCKQCEKHQQKAA